MLATSQRKLNFCLAYEFGLIILLPVHFNNFLLRVGLSRLLYEILRPVSLQESDGRYNIKECLMLWLLTANLTVNLTK